MICYNEMENENIHSKIKQICLRLSPETLKKLMPIAGDNLQEKIIYLINSNYDLVNRPIQLTEEQIKMIVDALKNLNKDNT